MNVEEMRSQSAEQLQLRDQEIMEEIYRLRNEKKIKQNVEKPHLLNQKKKERARVLTLLKEKIAKEKVHG